MDDPVAWPDPAYSWNPFTGQAFDQGDPDHPSDPYGNVSRLASKSGQTAFTVSAHPNPFNAVSTITLNLPQPGDVAVSVYITLGQEVAALHDLTNGPLSPGTHHFQLDASSLSSGVYIVHGRFAGQTLQKKIVVVK